MRYLMIQGTSSSVGKSIITMALCRIFSDEGYKVAPFKAQNMSSFSKIIDGYEIAYAQYIQAIAARAKPSVLMNPILLKPLGNYISKVIVLGKEYAIMHAKEYYNNFVTSKGLEYVIDSIMKLSKDNDLVIIEGAGSPAEINLRNYDIANMTLAKFLNSNVVIVGDIERGGVFASMLGTLELIDNKELVKGLIINKFRGDLDILKPAINEFEKLTKKTIIGVIPYIQDLRIPEEDSLSLKDNHNIEALIIRYPNSINLELDRLLKVSYVNDIPGVSSTIVLPPTKDLEADLEWLYESGLADWIRYNAKRGNKIIGVGEGYAMLCRSIDGIRGLGLLDAYLKKVDMEGYIKVNDNTYFINKHFHVYRSSMQNKLFGIYNNKKIVIGLYRDNIVGSEVYGMVRDLLTIADIQVKDRLDEEINRIASIVKKSLSLDKIKEIIGLS